MSKSGNFMTFRGLIGSFNRNNSNRIAEFFLEMRAKIRWDNHNLIFKFAKIDIFTDTYIVSIVNLNAVSNVRVFFVKQSSLCTFVQASAFG